VVSYFIPKINPKYPKTVPKVIGTAIKFLDIKNNDITHNTHSMMQQIPKIRDDFFIFSFFMMYLISSTNKY